MLQCQKTLGLLQAFATQLVKRSFHTGVSRHNSINLNNEHLKELYRDRIAPVKAFNKDLILATCFDIRNLKERSLFFLTAEEIKGGIYLIQYRHDPLVYYIGITNNFRSRLAAHLKLKANNKFHLFVKLVG